MHLYDIGRKPSISAYENAEFGPMKMRCKGGNLEVAGSRISNINMESISMIRLRILQ